MSRSKQTAETYGFLWTKDSKEPPAERWHYNYMQEVISEPIVRGKIGIEVGSGCGFDTYLMAKSNPSVAIVSLDMSDGIRKTKELTAGLSNVEPVQSSALDIPFKSDVFDFAYSFGVLHHTDDPERGLREIARVLKKGSSAYLYLYEDHSENPLKYNSLKLVTAVRYATVRLPKKALYAMCWVASPLVFLAFTVPARIFKRFGPTRSIAEKMPFNFGTGPFSLREDLYDRFGAPIERRYSRRGVSDMFAECGFSEIKITRLKDTAGWVVWGKKP